VLKYTTGAALRWTRTSTGAWSNTDTFNAVVLLGNGDVVAAGSSYTSVDANDALLVRYTPGGARRWARLYNGWPAIKRPQAAATACS
jgi:hypothetical protein